MDVKDDVVVYQVDQSSPCAECRTLLDPLEVTTNLLLEGERAHNFTVVSSNAFKPLHGEFVAQNCQSAPVQAYCNYRIHGRCLHVILFFKNSRLLCLW